MPKEIVQYGKKYYRVENGATDEYPAHWSDYPYSGMELLDPETNKWVPADVPKGDNVTLTRHPHLEVHWSKPEEFGVRAAGEDEEGKIQIMLDLDAAFLRDLAKRVDEEGVTATAAISQPLTRYQINKLIKVLRKARDQAFGTDE